MINLLSNKHKTSGILKYLFLLKIQNKNISKSQLKSKCVSTGRNKSVNNKFALSRIELRKLINTGLIYGYKKAVW
jgi:ribosomal protein S14